MPAQHYENIALLVTIYNRSASLERQLLAWEQLGVSFGEIVVSDDGSKPEHLDKVKALQERFRFRLITTPQNKGLGNNINKGQDAVTRPYTLYAQEDFVPKPAFTEHFRDAFELLEADASIDIARLFAYYPYPYTKPYARGFDELVFKWYYPGYPKFHYYSDHPHLRRSNFLEKFGRYREGENVNITEYTMTIDFLKKKGKAILFHDVYALFDEMNNADEPSTASYRPDWRTKNNIFVRALRKIFLQYKVAKCYKDLYF
ncbi:glycosyl transferase family 2 [Pedobacter yulinensis]|uniref:Glycosyl transferase family 2 n=1 Tax=Pedobacter yulinensis TaxID=2126353 RepID=A0A2T3HLT5_9SPHI|nr:glycosyltransferase [Pedobacter yulinensis]PST83373.1 glycosyl transferase family 2 [Pedobacter yulinensis]